MNARTWRSGLVLALVSFAGTALAIEEPDYVMSAQVDGGLNMYSGGLAGLLNTGPAWGARTTIDLGMALPVETEFSYEGGRNNVDKDVLGEDAGAIWKNGVSALALLGPTLMQHINPYVGVGVGGSFLHPTQDATPIFRDDFVFEVPFAAGVDYRARGFKAGVRATWRPLVGLEVGDSPVLGSPSGGLFMTTVNVGGRF